MQLNKKRGFTLIEILIVVAIIGVLASIVLVGLGPAQRQGRDARRLSDMKQMQTALELYFQKCGFYPGFVRVVFGSSPCAGVAIANGTAAGWTALQTELNAAGLGFSGQIPNDPIAARSYSYGSNGGTGLPDSGTRYILGAVLEGSSPAVNNDIDGSGVITFGVECGPFTGADQYYCTGN